MINVGFMRERVTFQRLMTLQDSIGNPTQKWEDFYSCKAYCNSLFGDEFYKAAEVGLEKTLKMTIRFSKKISELDTRNIRLVFRKKYYDITFIDNPNFKNETLIISAKLKETSDENEQDFGGGNKRLLDP